MERRLWTMFAAMVRRFAGPRFVLGALVFLSIALRLHVAIAAPLLAGDTSIDRTTPRRAWVGFDAACASGEFERASRYLDLRAAPHKPHDSAELARELCYVLSRKSTVNAQTLPDAPEAGGEHSTVTVATIVVDEDTLPVELARVRFSDGMSRWILSRGTVAAIPELNAAFGPRGLEDRMPEVLREPHVFAMAPWQWIGVLVFAAGALGVAWVLAWVLLGLVRRVTERAKNALDDHVIASARRPILLLLAVAIFRAASPLLAFEADAWTTLARLQSSLTVLGFAWLAIRIMRGIVDWLEARASEAEREYGSRGLRTQLAVLYRVATIVVLVVAVAAVLLQFEVVRSVGTSLLASAGIAGIVIGLAAQKSLGAIIAGVQISIAQPVRIGDTVVVDAQQGVVEEIHLTYVVLRLVDDRRLVAPIGRFLDQSFENWTKLGSPLSGYVLLPADFGVPIDDVRAELEVVCKKSPYFDGRHCRLDVVDVTADKALTLRATVSAKDADALWELRCSVREAMVKFLVALNAGKHVPRTRAQAVS